MAAKPLKVHPPLGGLHRSFAYQSQPPFTMIDGVNVRVRDTFDNRERLGSRPGMADVLPSAGKGGAVMSGYPIRMLNVCRTLNSDPTNSFVDTFPGAAMSASWSHLDWVPPTGGAPNSDGLPTVSGGSARSLGDNTLATAILDETPDGDTPSVDAPRGLTGRLLVSSSTRNIHLWLMLDMDEVSPNPLSCILLNAEWQRVSSTVHRIYFNMYQNGSSVASVTHPVPFMVSTTHGRSINFGIDETNTVKVLVDGTEVLSYNLGTYVPSGGRVGFALEEDASGTTAQLDYFIYSYHQAGGGVPPRCLVASAGGGLYRENTNGVMTAVSTTLTLASDRPLSSVPYLDRLYIADYHKFASGTTATLAGGVLTHAGATFDALTEAVLVADYRLEILTEGNGTAGIYNITARTATTITYSGTPETASGVHYRVMRAPKVFDSADLTLAKVPIGTVGVSQYPLGCTIVQAWFDRLLWSGDPDYPHIVYASKSGYPDDYTYGTAIGDLVPGQAFVYDPARTTGASSIGDAVTAIIPFSDHYCLFCGYKTVSVQRDDPTFQGGLDLVTREFGAVSWSAWCHTPEKTVIVLSNDGLYEFFPGPEVEIVPLSRHKLPKELININPELFDAQLVYDVGRRGVNVFVTPKTEGVTTKHFWVDLQRKRGGNEDAVAIFQDSYPQDKEPTASTQHVFSGSTTPAVVLGCRDGILRRFEDRQRNDDGVEIESYAVLGPFSLGHPGYEGIIQNVYVEMDRGSDPVIVELLVGDSPETAWRTAAADSFTTTEDSASANGVQPNWIPRLRGGACFVRIVNGASVCQWALEAMTIWREVVSRFRGSF